MMVIFLQTGIFLITSTFLTTAHGSLGRGQKAKAVFSHCPLLKAAAYEFKIGKFTPSNGFIKAKLNSPVSFNIKLNTSADIDIVSLEIGAGKKKKTKTVDHIFTRGSIIFNYKFDQADTYPVTVLINNKPVLGYMVEVNE